MTGARSGAYRERRVDSTHVTTALISISDACSTAEVRSSLFTRFYDPDHSSWTSSLVEPAPMHVAVPQQPHELNDVLASCRTLLIDDAFSCRIVVDVGERELENSEGVSQRVRRTWCDVEVTRLLAGEALRSYEGTEAIADVPEVVARRLAAIERRVARRASKAQAPTTANLLLEPAVSEILFHELVGHGSEAASFHPIDLPFKIVATHPLGKGHDDEGVLITPIVLVGRHLNPPPLDRETAGGVGASGLAQAAFHAGPPRVRCTHMTVEADCVTSDISSDGAVRCHDVASAELWGETAVIRVVDAEIAGPTGPAAVEPFDIVLSAADLGRSLIAAGPTTGSPRGGRCSKRGDVLPTLTHAPTMLLADVTLHPA